MACCLHTAACFATNTTTAISRQRTGSGSTTFPFSTPGQTCIITDMDKNTTLINRTERERLRQKYLVGIPDDVYDTLWALEVKQQEQQTYEYASGRAFQYILALASEKFVNGDDKKAKELREIAMKMRDHMIDNKPKYETYAMAESEE